MTPMLSLFIPRDLETDESLITDEAVRLLTCNNIYSNLESMAERLSSRAAADSLYLIPHGNKEYSNVVEQER